MKMNSNSSYRNFKKLKFLEPDLPRKSSRSVGSRLRYSAKLTNLKVILYIDTSNNKKVYAALRINGQKKEVVKKTDTWTSQILLPIIDELLSKNNLTPCLLTEIKVNTGPGSFTGLRVGVAVANTLGWILGIPVNGEKNRFIEPVYK